MDANPDPEADIADSDQEITLSHRLAFLQMTERDRQRLRELAPLLKAHSSEFVETFYQHLFAFNVTAQFLQDPEVVERLKEMQQLHLESMLEDELNEEYVVRRRRVGNIHAQIGINPQMFLGAYNQYLQYGLRQLAKEEKPSSEFAEQTLSLLKAVFLDIGLTLDAYFLQATQELRQALEMVYRANTELRQFAELTSHDLKTPLATVANLCDEALDEFSQEMPPAACQLIESAKERTFRMSTMIDELLSLSRTDGEKAEVQINSRDIIEDVRERLASVLSQREIELVVAPDLPLVWGNRVRLREAFFNLLSNSAKYIDKHPARIHVSVNGTEDEWIFAISDNGPGIPREDLERIFSPFRRLRMHQHQPGSGLGLYFTKNLIEQEHGRVWAEAELGKGSVFYVALKKHA